MTVYWFNDLFYLIILTVHTLAVVH